MHKAVRPSNYFFSNSFTYNQAEQINKEIISVQILLEIHLTEHYGTPEGTFLFQYLPEKKSKQKELERKSKQ